ncbi:MAG TPA: hypothetical protein VKA21_07965, partial [Candidatus Binatia bacterium]|nr:hypothetical protein [Candidatus Binatia bacterium]
MACAAAILVGLDAGRALGWGAPGHAIVARAALAASADLPAWFREARPALAELAGAPDRWREVDQTVPALAARRPDHFFDLDVWGMERLPPDRWSYVERAGRRRLAPAGIGFLPYAITEEYGVLLSAFRDARDGRAGGQEAAVVAAGVLAHLAGDAAVPLHATRHHHGWIGPNPRGYTTDAGVHRWFETDMVERIAGETRAGPGADEAMPDVAAAIAAALADSLGQVPRLYAAERASRVEADDGPARRLVAERLGAG